MNCNPPAEKETAEAGRDRGAPQGRAPAFWAFPVQARGSFWRRATDGWPGGQVGRRAPPARRRKPLLGGSWAMAGGL